MPGMRWLVKIFFSVNSITNKMAMTKFRKGTYGKKRRGLRRRLPSRVNRVYRPLRPRNAVHYHSRYSFYQAPQVALTMDASGQFFGVMHAIGIDSIYTDISTISMPNRTEFTALFDQYKILSYTIELRPRFNSRDAAYGAGTVADIPTVYWVYDQDDATPPSSMSQLMEHPKVRSGRLDKPVYITVKYPTVTTLEYNGGIITNGYSVKRSPWIDCNSYQVPHYGVKYAIQGTIDRDYKALFDIRVKWRLAFKNPR